MAYILIMQRVLTICAACAALTFPAYAEDKDAQSLMEKGAELLFEGLRQEMGPALDDLMGLADQFGPAMQSLMQEMGPALAELATQIEDWSVYEVPELLPNGDIIIRKKPQQDAEPEDEPQVAPDGLTDI